MSALITGSGRSLAAYEDCQSNGTTDHNRTANERTFLGYLRSSQMFSMMGVFVAQFFRLQHSLSPDPVFGFHVVSIPLSSVFHIAAILLILIGTVRFLKLQKTMAMGKAIAGGWEIYLAGGMAAAVSQSRRPTSFAC